MKLLRAPLLILVMVLLAWNAAAVSAQTAVQATDGTTPKNIELLQWAVTQGGLVLVTLVVVWSYRRDFARVFEGERAKNMELMIALQASTVAMTQHAELLRDNTAASREQMKAFSDLSGAVKACELAREIFDEAATPRR